MPGAGPFYLATAVDGLEVTLRLLHGNWTRDAAARDRFAAEAGSARRVQPFCAARILDAGVEDDKAYLVSEYIAGKSLLEMVSDDGRLRGPDLEALAIGSATGLASVHQAGLVHGGFGPEHVIMNAAGPRVIEFGITPPYGSATPSADMLAWAQTMVFAAMGRPPNPRADLDVLPELLRQAAADCLSGDPALRPTARSVVLDLLDDPEPPVEMLAEGSRRAAQAVHAAPVAWESQPARGMRSGPGGRSGQAGDPQRQRRPRRGAGRVSGRRGGALPIAAAIVVIVAVGVLIVHVVQGAGGPGGQPQANAGPLTTPASSSTSPVSSTVSALPSAPATVPASFAGSWSGQARQVNPSIVFDVRLRLSAGAADGRVAYSSGSFSCAGPLSLRASGPSTLVLDQGIGAGQRGCASGVVMLSMSAGGDLQYTFRGKTGPAASGTLTRR